jgi:NAD(P) transhydrogenase subunit alpha
MGVNLPQSRLSPVPASPVAAIAMIVACVKETFPGERRVALVPASVGPLVAAGWEVRVEAGAGEAAGFIDAQYRDKGAAIVPRGEALAADCLVQVRALGANSEAGGADLGSLRAGQVVIGMCDPLGSPDAVRALAERGVTLFALELVPRISRAQSMDVLSSQATVAGYRAVLLAATTLPKMFPMMTTAAGTITPAKVFVVGAGVAGLQAIATARRMGAVVSAYDVRAAVKEQVQSLGGRFIEMELAAGAEAAGGYARQMDEEFYRRQREMMHKVVAENDVVITTAAVPGKKAPTLVTAEMVAAMAPGSVIVDVAAERGGNCELTRPGETVVSGGVTILGPANLPSDVPFHASQMFAKNVTTFLANLVKDGRWNLDTTDEVTRDTLVARDGQVVNAQIRELLGIAEPAKTWHDREIELE